MAASGTAAGDEGGVGTSGPPAKRVRTDETAEEAASAPRPSRMPSNGRSAGPSEAGTDEVEVTLLEEEDGGEAGADEETAAGGDGAAGLTAAMEEEERRLEAESAKEDEEWREAQRKEMTKKGKNTKKAVAERVARLNSLLEKSIVYSEFLADKLKNPHALTGVSKNGAATGAGSSQGITSKDLGRLPQPHAVTGGTMRDYQLVGVHWLTGLYENGLNGILGDEMGLGKTVQTIGFLAFLRERQTYGPFLIVGPLSTVGNWANEFKRWAPSIPVVMYHGSKDEREQIRSDRMRFPDSTKPDFPVVITSYEIVLRDFKELRRYKWKFLVVDEGHRLKNLNCKLIRTLKAMNTGNRLLLSGTPLQNNLTELWSLLNFLLPDIFDDLDSFQQWFDFSLSSDSGEKKILKDEEEQQVVTKLHLILKPFLLRRLKQDVDLSIPPKHEYVLFCDPTEQQRRLYVQILNKEVEEATGGVRLQNVLMQLRKVCNHPFLFNWPKDEGGGDIIDDRIVQHAGKMILLDRIMSKLRAEGGHQTLIFSQMTSVLDVLEDWCELRGLSWERLDGSVPAAERQAAMERFNRGLKAGGADVFLLSTRAGGLGVNLVSADTCIIYDSDWNPHADLQAQDRCHRIGQRETVLVFRLATADTVEEEVLAAAKNKLRLEQLVISKGKYKLVGEKTNREEKIKRKELQALLAFDPAKAALGKGGGKAITDAELALVMDRSGHAKDTGHGFTSVENLGSKAKFDVDDKAEAQAKAK